MIYYYEYDRFNEYNVFKNQSFYKDINNKIY